MFRRGCLIRFFRNADRRRIRQRNAEAEVGARIPYAALRMIGCDGSAGAAGFINLNLFRKGLDKVLNGIRNLFPGQVYIAAVHTLLVYVQLKVHFATGAHGTYHIAVIFVLDPFSRSVAEPPVYVFFDICFRGVRCQRRTDRGGFRIVIGIPGRTVAHRRKRVSVTGPIAFLHFRIIIHLEFGTGLQRKCIRIARIGVIVIIRIHVMIVIIMIYQVFNETIDVERKAVPIRFIEGSKRMAIRPAAAHHISKIIAVAFRSDCNPDGILIDHDTHSGITDRQGRRRRAQLSAGQEIHLVLLPGSHRPAGPCNRILHSLFIRNFFSGRDFFDILRRYGRGRRKLVAVILHRGGVRLDLGRIRLVRIGCGSRLMRNPDVIFCQVCVILNPDIFPEILFRVSAEFRRQRGFQVQ